MQTKKFRDRSCCPTFLLVIAGPWLCILGAIYTEKVIVEPLTDFISLLAKPQDNRQLQRVTRIFQALRLGLNQLAKFYSTMNLDGPEDDERYFPFRRYY